MTDRKAMAGVFVGLVLAGLAGPLAAAVPAGGNWAAWRGDGSGISIETNLPTVWTATNHVVWRAPLPGEGSSSPVVWGTRVFVTASMEEGHKRAVLCLDLRDGHELWRRVLDAERAPKTDPSGAVTLAPRIIW